MQDMWRDEKVVRGRDLLALKDGPIGPMRIQKLVLGKLGILHFSGPSPHVIVCCLPVPARLGQQPQLSDLQCTEDLQMGACYFQYSFLRQPCA